MHNLTEGIQKMAEFKGFMHGMGIGGWLTNYKRFHVLPQHRRFPLTVGDFEHFENYITQKDIDYIASLGMDHIRLGFDQIVLEEYENPGVYRECIWKIFDNFISWCENAGCNIVLNMHKAIGNYCDVQEDRKLLDCPDLQERFIKVWEAFEDRYAEKKEIAFEILNEVKYVDPAQWNDLAERTVAAIRKKNPVRKIIIGSIGFNAAHTLKDLKVYDDPNIMYTWHFYTPFEFTHQRGVLQGDPLYYNRDMEYPGDIEKYRDFHKTLYGRENAYPEFTRMDKDFLRAAMAPAFEFAEAHPDKIVWCGEFGTIRHCKIEYRENYMRDVISLLKEHNMAYCCWNYLSTPNDGNRFSLVDDDRRKILSEEMAAIIAGKR